MSPDMVDIAPGVTRYPVSAGNPTRRLPRIMWAVPVLFFLMGAAAPVFTGGVDLVTVALVVVGLLTPTVTLLLPWWSRPLALFGVVGLLVVRADWGTDRGLAYAACAATSLGLGVAIAWWFVERRGFQDRARSGEGAPPTGLDPTGGADVGVLARWRDDRFEYEASDPRPEVVLDAVRALDGGSRSIVTVYRGRGRMDVGGDAAGDMVVQQADRRRRWTAGFQVTGPSWRAPTSAEEAAEVRTRWVRFGGAELEFPEDLLTTIGPARTAISTWLDEGVRDASLTWWSPPERGREIRRPPSLKEQDRPGSSRPAGTGDIGWLP